MCVRSLLFFLERWFLYPVLKRFEEVYAEGIKPWGILTSCTPDSVESSPSEGGDCSFRGRLSGCLARALGKPFQGIYVYKLVGDVFPAEVRRTHTEEEKVVVDSSSKNVG